MKKTFTILLILVALASCSSVPEIVSGKGAVYGTISVDSHKDIIAKASKGKDGIYGKNGKVIFTDKMVNYHNLKELFVCLLDPSFPGAGTTIRSSLPTKICPIDPWQLPPAMIVGNIGSEKNLEYTCIGDTVNYSSRLEGINKMYGTDIIINVFTKKNVEHDLLLWKLDTIQVKGRA